MIGIDTNVLVRYLVQDDTTQAQVATNLLENYIGRSASIFINNIVICELVWVLERGYKYKRDEIANVLQNILSTTEFAFEDIDSLLYAHKKYTGSDIDFSDALIGKINLQHKCTKTITFDRGTKNDKNFEILS